MEKDVGENTLRIPKARINGSGTVKTPEGAKRQDEIIEEQKPEVKEQDDGSQSWVNNPNRPV